MQYLDTETAQAVVFFDDEGVVKELLYPEFEAILDGYAPLDEWAESTQKAAYIEFTSQFLLTSAVFFTMNFDGKGAVEASWNLPLVDMARTASRGPDLGAGPIHLVCRSQCPVAYFQDWLWDPDLRSASSHFTQIKKALKRNRLGLLFQSTGDTGAKDEATSDAKQIERNLSEQFSKKYEVEFRNQMAQLLKEQRLRISSINSDRDEEIKQLRLDHIKKMEDLQQELMQRQALVGELEERNQELKGTIDGQAKKIEGLRDYFEHKLRRLQGSEGADLDSVKEQITAEVEVKVASATKDLTDLLKMKDLEVSYLTDHSKQLQQEVHDLRSVNQELIKNSGEQLLERLSQKGVNYVTYQPGAGHITIPYTDLHQFVENPCAFTAQYCGVSEKHYQSWLKHYQTPVCCALLEDGTMCCADLTRVKQPDQFIPGETDLCADHQSK